MNPWNVLGWIIVVLCAIPIAILVFCAIWVSWDKLKTLAARRIRHYRTRNTPPRTGQVWWQDGDWLSIRVADNGAICVSTGNCGWGDSPEDWAKRVRSRKLYLIKDAP